MQPVSTPSPDPLLETQLFWSRFKNPILGAALILLLGLAGYAAYRLHTISRDNAAAKLLSEAKGAPDYEKVIGDYPSSGAAISAYIKLAMQQREKRQFSEANATLEKFVNAHAKSELVTTAKMAMAANLESQGKSGDALDLYGRIASDYAQSFNAPLALLARVPLLKQQGKIEDARRACETVMAQYKESYAAQEASRLLATLKTKEAAVPVPAAPASATVTTVPSMAPVASSPAGSASPKR